MEISALPRENRGKDVGVYGDYDPWKIDEEVIDEDEDGDDEVTMEDIRWILQGFHPSMGQEDIDQHREMIQGERENAKNKEKMKEEKDADKTQAKGKDSSKPGEADKDDDIKEEKISYRYRGLDQYTGKALHPELIRRGAISDYYEPWLLKPVNYTRGWKFGMKVNAPEFEKDPATQANLIEKELGLVGNELIEEPFTGYKWPMKCNLTLAAAKSRRGKPLVERHTEGTLYACTFVKLAKTKYGNTPKKADDMLVADETEAPAEDADQSPSMGEPIDQIALYVDYEAARDYFVKEGAKLIPLDEESDRLPPKTGVSAFIERAASWYFNDWPDRLNPFPPKIKTEFTRREEAYGKAFMQGKFAKKVVIRFGAAQGVKRWTDIFESMRGECGVQKPAEGGASEAYRFQKMIEAFEESIEMQDALEGGEMILDFDSQNRAKVTLKRGKRFWHIPIEDPYHAFQGAEQEAFRSCELLLGAFFSRNHQAPYSHLKSIFNGAAKSLFTKLDALKPARTYVKQLRNLIAPKEYVLNKDLLEQEQQWEVDFDDRTRLPRPFEEVVEEVERKVAVKSHLQYEMERTGIWDRSKSKAYKSSVFKVEEDPAEVAKKIEAAKKEIKNPFPLPESKDGGLTYQFTPEMKKKTDILSVEFDSEMKDSARELREVLSEFDQEVLVRAILSRVSAYNAKRAEEKFEADYERAEQNEEEYDFNAIPAGKYLPLQMDPPAIDVNVEEINDQLSTDETILQLVQELDGGREEEIDPIEFYGSLASNELSTSLFIANRAYNKRNAMAEIDMVPIPVGLGFEESQPSGQSAASAGLDQGFSSDFPPMTSGSSVTQAASMPPGLQDDFPAMTATSTPSNDFPPMNPVPENLMSADVLRQKPANLYETSSGFPEMKPKSPESQKLDMQQSENQMPDLKSKPNRDMYVEDPEMSNSIADSANVESGFEDPIEERTDKVQSSAESDTVSSEATKITEPDTEVDGKEIGHIEGYGIGTLRPSRMQAEETEKEEEEQEEEQEKEPRNTEGYGIDTLRPLTKEDTNDSKPETR